MALKPADFASLPALINGLRVTCKYKKPVYWRERPDTTYIVLQRTIKENLRSERKEGDTYTHEFAVTIQLTTAGVLARGVGDAGGFLLARALLAECLVGLVVFDLWAVVLFHGVPPREP